MDFPLLPGQYLYRPIKAPISGWDAYALQTGLIGLDYKLPRFGADGFISVGGETSEAIFHFQKANGLTADRIAGVITQRAVLLKYASKETIENTLPEHLLSGHIESESSFWVGQYTAPYDDGTRDFGAVQINKPPTPANLVQVFNVPNSVNTLGGFLRARYEKYWKNGTNVHVTSEKRAWQLAAGAWNRPAWTDALANGGTLSQSQLEWINGYIARVTAYVVDWTP